MQHPLQAVADRQIDQLEINREQKHGDDHHRRRPLNCLARGRRPFLHLRAHVVVKAIDPLGPGPQRGCNRVLFYRCRHTFPLSSTAPSRAKILAGAEGFEPPSSVLETDSLTVELTPLFPSGDRYIDDPIYFTSLCGVCLRHRLQNFFTSPPSRLAFPFLPFHSPPSSPS